MKEKSELRRGRLERLAEVLRTLGSDRKIAKPELLELAGVTSQSSFKRIKAVLKSVGLPLKYDPADNCYHLPPGATFLRFRLDPRLRSQIAQLRAVASGLDRFVGDALEDVLAPYEAQLMLDDPGARAVLSLRQPQPRPSPELYAAVDLALTAIREHHWLSFDYRKSAGDPSGRRTLAPYALHLHDGRYYLWGQLEGEDATKLFALDLTSELVIEEDRFAPDPRLDFEDELRNSFGVMLGDEPPRRIVVRFAPAAASFVRCRRWPAEVAMRDDGEELLVEFAVSKPDEIVAWVLGFGGAARVESPDDVRELVRERARAILAAHGGSLAVRADARDTDHHNEDAYTSEGLEHAR